MSKNVYILGGYQTDFADNFTKQGKELVDLFRDTVQGALSATSIDAQDVQTAHVGNFIGELMCYQGHLGAFFLEADPAFNGIPTARHEAACASGSIALLSAMAEIEAGRYDLACVLGVEMERNKAGAETAGHLGVAAWHARECTGVKYPWPHLFSRLAEEYDRRYGLSFDHLAHLAKNNFDNAKRNPNAQTRGWEFRAESFLENDEFNPVIDGRIRRQDCSQVTDGGAALFLASETYAKSYAKKRGIPLAAIPRVKGWGHHTARLAFDDKIAASKDAPYVFPQVRATITDALQRAEMSDVWGLDAIETHDCFTPTAYMAIDHFGITDPGESRQAIDAGVVDFDGQLPLNPSGGLMGAGHPVGATGVRMALDAWKQVTGNAGDYQVPGAENVATLNIGGSATTSVSLIVGVN